MAMSRETAVEICQQSRRLWIYVHKVGATYAFYIKRQPEIGGGECKTLIQSSVPFSSAGIAASTAISVLRKASTIVSDCEDPQILKLAGLMTDKFLESVKDGLFERNSVHTDTLH